MSLKSTEFCTNVSFDVQSDFRREKSSGGCRTLPMGEGRGQIYFGMIFDRTLLLIIIMMYALPSR